MVFPSSGAKKIPINTVNRLTEEQSHKKGRKGTGSNKNCKKIPFLMASPVCVVGHYLFVGVMYTYNHKRKGKGS